MEEVSGGKKVKLFHRHKWVQVKNITFGLKPGNIDGTYFFCEKCFAFRAQILDSNVPQFHYAKNKEGKK